MFISVNNVEKYFGERLIFSVNKLEIFKGDRIGIVGDNGAGKSTLLRVLCGVAKPDCGNVRIGCTIALALADCEPFESMSGGELMKSKLDYAFAQDADIIALDEPTANLDADAIAALQERLFGVQTLLLISHDRQLLDAHCNKIIKVDSGNIGVFLGGFSEFLQAEEMHKKRQSDLYVEYAKEKRRMEQSAVRANERADSIKKAPSRMGNSEARLHRRSATAKQAKIMNASKAIKSRLERLEAVEKPILARAVRADFSLTNPPQNKIVISAKALSFSYGQNAVLSDASFEIYGGSKTAIVGANGAGKSTLLRLIYQRPDLVYRVPKARLGMLSQDFSHIDMEKSALDNVLLSAVQSQTVCRTTLANLGLRGDSALKKARVLSGGELVKLSIAKLAMSECNILLLDEPTNFLDYNSLLAVSDAIRAYQGTVIFVSHDRDFVAKTADTTLEIAHGSIK